MKILVISGCPWDDSNSFGSTFSNIFGGMSNIEIANIYCKSGNPDNSVVSRYFRITEGSILSNLKNSNNPSGKEVFADELQKNSENTISSEKTDFFRKHRFQIFFECRELIWSLGKWKSQELKDFLDDFDADIIFAPLFGFRHMLHLVKFIKQYTGKKMVTYMADDGYTLKQWRFSPLFWIDRFIQRKLHRDCIKMSETLYVISQKQKEVYDKIFYVNSKILCKGNDFTQEPDVKDNYDMPYKMVYTGNIADGRWTTIEKIGKALEKINSNGTKAVFYIYTQTPMTEKMNRALGVDSIELMGAVPAEEVAAIQKDADIVVHVESFELKHRLHVALSFSTKLVDYFKNARCIFAVGPYDVASIDYLIKNDAAVVITDKNDVFTRLNELIENEDMICEYALKAYSCGRSKHQIEEIQNNLYNDFEKLLGE